MRSLALAISILTLCAATAAYGAVPSGYDNTRWNADDAKCWYTDFTLQSNGMAAIGSKNPDEGALLTWEWDVRGDTLVISILDESDPNNVKKIPVLTGTREGDALSMKWERKDANGAWLDESCIYRFKEGF